MRKIHGRIIELHKVKAFTYRRWKVLKTGIVLISADHRAGFHSQDGKFPGYFDTQAHLESAEPGECGWLASQWQRDRGSLAQTQSARGRDARQRTACRRRQLGMPHINTEYMQLFFNKVSACHPNERIVVVIDGTDYHLNDALRAPGTRQSPSAQTDAFRTAPQHPSLISTILIPDLMKP